MKTETQIISVISGFQFGYWDEEQEKFIPIEEDNRKETAKKLECSEKLLETIEENFAVLRDMLNEDLSDIWQQLSPIK